MAFFSRQSPLHCDFYAALEGLVREIGTRDGKPYVLGDKRHQREGALIIFPALLKKLTRHQMRARHL